MDPFHRPIEELPSTFAVFPLTGALLLPRGKLPLNIFEPRYLAMVEDAMAAGRMFGMVQPDPKALRGPGGPGLYRVGCLGRIASFSETDDGRFLVTLCGLTRFAIAEEQAMHRGYRRIRADLAPYAADLVPCPAIGFDRPGLLAALRGYFLRRGFDANWEAIDKMPDDALVVTLAMVCPFDPPEKQALLEAADETARAQTLRTLLEIDTHTPPPGRAS